MASDTCWSLEFQKGDPNKRVGKVQRMRGNTAWLIAEYDQRSWLPSWNNYGAATLCNASFSNMYQKVSSQCTREAPACNIKQF